MRAVVLAAALALAAGAIGAQERPDTAAVQRPDTLGRQPADTALPDTTLRKIRERAPLFPEDIDPYTPIGLGRPAVVLRRDELKGWPGATLADLLPRVYPLAADDQGGPGFFQDLHFPSGPAQATRLLIDGRPLESPLDLAADLRTIPLAAVERIEIRPGSAPVPGGAEAGWINIVTRTHLSPQSNSALAFELASLGHEGFRASLGRWLGTRLSVFAGLQFDDAETFTQVASAKRTRLFGKARLYLSRRHFLEAAYGTSGATTDTRRAATVPPSPFTGSEDRKERRLQVLLRGPAGPVLASVRAFADDFEERKSFALSGAPQVLGDFERRGARADLRMPLGGGTAEAGVEWLEERLESESPAFVAESGIPLEDLEGSPFSAPLGRLALFAGAEQAFDSLSVAAHIRAERFDFEAGSATEPSLSAEARFAAPRGFSPFVRVGRAVRAPTFAEQAVLARAGENSVRLARTRELRAGSGWRRSGYAAELAVFDRRSADEPVWLPPTAWRAVAGDESLRSGDSLDFLPGEFADLTVLDLRARGVELRLEAPLPLGVRGEAVAQLQSVEDADGFDIPYVAAQHAVGRLTYESFFFPSRNLRVRASVGTRIAGARTTREGEELPAYAVMDGLLRVQLIGFTVGLSAQNLLDLRYRTEERFPLPGRLIGFEVFWEFWD